MIRDDLRYRPRILLTSLAGAGPDEALPTTSALAAAGMEVDTLQRGPSLARAAPAADVIVAVAGPGQPLRACLSLRRALEGAGAAEKPLVVVGALERADALALSQAGVKQVFSPGERAELVEFVEWLIEPKVICAGTTSDVHHRV